MYKNQEVSKLFNRNNFVQKNLQIYSNMWIDFPSAYETACFLSICFLNALNLKHLNWHNWHLCRSL